MGLDSMTLRVEVRRGEFVSALLGRIESSKGQLVHCTHEVSRKSPAMKIRHARRNATR